MAWSSEGHSGCYLQAEKMLKSVCCLNSRANFLCLESDIANRFQNIAPYLPPFVCTLWSLPHV